MQCSTVNNKFYVAYTAENVGGRKLWQIDGQSLKFPSLLYRTFNICRPFTNAFSHQDFPLYSMSLAMPIVHKHMHSVAVHKQAISESF